MEKITTGLSSIRPNTLLNYLIVEFCFLPCIWLLNGKLNDFPKKETILQLQGTKNARKNNC